MGQKAKIGDFPSWIGANSSVILLRHVGVSTKQSSVLLDSEAPALIFIFVISNGSHRLLTPVVWETGCNCGIQLVWGPWNAV